MKNEKYLIIYLLILLVVLLVVVNLCYEIDFNPDLPKENTIEKEYEAKVRQKQAEIKAIRKRYDSLSMVMYNDSLENVARVKYYNAEIKRLKNNVKKIDLTNSNPAVLDSITGSLYPVR